MSRVTPPSRSKQKVFAAAAEAFEAPPRDPAAELLGGGLLPQTFVSHLDGQKPAPHQQGGQTPADDFHLGEFRHGALPASGGPGHGARRS